MCTSGLLAELTARGCVTADSFEGLRALLVPAEKRAPFTHQWKRRSRHHKAVTSVEFAGRWSPLLRPSIDGGSARRMLATMRVEAFARVLLRRSGVVFRRMLERESLKVSWLELSRFYRRLEARGEIRGGYFINGVSGEQFALPEAIGLLRSIRKAVAEGEMIAISGADPLNLAGILSPGLRIAAITAPGRIPAPRRRASRGLESGTSHRVCGRAEKPDAAVERALRVGKMLPALRPYYA